MRCPRCKTTDPKYFYKVNDRWYCRRCIAFGRIFCDEELKSLEVSKINEHVYYELSYALSSAQKNIAQHLMENFKQHKDSVVWAVCGSGKTELIYDSIAYALNQNLRVCVAIPRRTLVEEIGERIHKQFIGIVPSLFYGGHQGDLSAPLIVCTTHQLYRFYKSFDLLILDETDAYPYQGNPLLKDLLFGALKGNYIFMSATLDAESYPNAELFVLNRRYHLIDLPTPKWQFCLGKMWKNQVQHYLMKWKKPTLIYVPRIKDLDQFKGWQRRWRYATVSSHSKDVSSLIDKLRHRDLDFLVTTTLLERGVTIEDVQVIVIEADHCVYTKAVLLQIAGRVGRSPKAPTGEVIFLSSQKTKAITQCIQTIIDLNHMTV